MRKFVLWSVSALSGAALLACVLFAEANLSPRAPQARRTVWSGVYTPAQAARGKAEFDRTCARCHGTNLDGIQDANLLGDFAPRNPIRGKEFMERWREDTVQSLFTYIVNGMPPRTDPLNKPVSLTRETYLDIVTYLLQANGFPSGDRELDFSNLRAIRIQEKNGPRPLDSFSRVQVVGCLTQFEPGKWQLSQASQPIRIRDVTPPTEDDINAADSLGELAFDLQNLGFLGREFTPLKHESHTVMVRGVLLRQPPVVRIDVRSLVELSDTCEP
jgi:cytochrome c5